MRATDDTRRNVTRMDFSDVCLDKAVLNFEKPLIKPKLIAQTGIELVETGGQSWVAWREHNESETAGRKIRPSEGCLESFWRLAHARDEDILEFAKRWGVLGIWPRIAYEQTRVPDIEAEAYYPAPVYSESTSFWRKVAGRAEGMLLVATSLFEGEIASYQDWEKILDLHYLPDWCRKNGYKLPSESTGVADISASGQRALLVSCAQEWLDQICVTPVLRWDSEKTVPGLHLDVNCDPSDREHGRRAKGHNLKMYFVEDPEVVRNQPFDVCCPNEYAIHQLRPSRLFNVIVLQLIAALSSPEGVYRCDICGKPFKPENRRPRTDRRKLCLDNACHNKAHSLNSVESRRKAASRKASDVQ